MHLIPLNIPDNNLPDKCTIKMPATGKGRYVRQTACSGFGIITLRLEPYPGPEPFLLVWQVAQEQIPPEFIPGVVEGIRQVAQQERAEGGRLTHIKVRVIDGSFHPVDSSVQAYTRATFLAFEEALTRTTIIPFIEAETKPENFTP